MFVQSLYYNNYTIIPSMTKTIIALGLPTKYVQTNKLVILNKATTILL